MKKLFAIFTTTAILISLTSCNGNSDAQSSSNTSSPSSNNYTTSTDSNVNTATLTDITTSTPEEEIDLSAIELINCHIDDEGSYCFDMDSWQKSDDFDLYRKYFFGEWKNSEHYFRERFPLFIMDDSEKSFLMNQHDWFFADFYKVSENVLAFYLGAIAEPILFWIDINNPDTMYSQSFTGFLSEDVLMYKLYANAQIFTKTDTKPNDPENNFLSLFKIHEMSQDYGIDFDMLVKFTYDNEGGKEALHHDDQAQFYPVYLVSEAPDKLMLKTTVGNVYSPDKNVSAEYTIEKINGEWTRTIEFDV